MSPKKKSGADKKAKKEAKAQALKAQSDKYKADKEKLDKALNAVDVFDTFKAFKRIQKSATGLDATLEYRRAEQLSVELKDQMFAMLKTNMQTFYAECEGFGWHEKDKRKEMDDPNARFLIAYDTKSMPAAAAPAPAPAPAAAAAADAKTDSKSAPAAPAAPVLLGFAHIRYLFEDEERILYVWELQLDTPVKRKGLGKSLMSVIELLAWKLWDFERMALTVFKKNVAANKFFRDTCKFETDDADPSLHAPDEADRIGYSILCKHNPKLAAAAVAGSGGAVGPGALVAAGSNKAAEAAALAAAISGMMKGGSAAPAATAAAEAKK